jgi:CheY-like chemotaxis protein
MVGMDDPPHTCPYCGRPLHTIAQQSSGRGTFECERCGEFPNLTAAGPIDPQAFVHGSPRARRHDDRPRVLLVDDSAEYRDLYALMLEQTASVITASNGEDALAVAATEPIDAIVLDVMMPGLDGWQTCERLKADPATSSIPVIMLTSLDGLGVPETAARLGAAYVLIKPCPVERLAIAIREALR